MSRRVRRRIAGSSHVPTFVSGLGVVLLVAFVVETVYFSELRAEYLLTWGMFVNLLMAAPFFVALIYGGYWLGRSDVGPERYRRAGLWCLGGATWFLALNAAAVAVWTPESFWVAVGWLRNTLTMGAGAGLAIGVSEARAIEGALAAERSRIEADALESRRVWLDYLNGLLRHEVLNNAQVISGYTSVLLRDLDLDEEARERLEVVRRQSEDMTRVTEDVRLLIEATSGADRLRPIDLGGVLESEIEDLEASYAGIEVEADLPASVSVRADEMLARAVSNLLANAVEHAEDGEPQVEVRTSVGPENVTVSVADEGPGIPAAVRESLFERPEGRAGEHGLGLHLVDQIVERYDGDLDLVETGPEGSVFAVELPRADPDGERGPAG